jgi:tetratricopeptide repeat protein 21B
MSLARENYKQTAASLDQARAQDFEIRNTPLFHLMKARLLDVGGQSDEALKVLEQSMTLPGVKRVNPKAPLPLQDRISLFLELASIHAKMNHVPEATKVMLDAKNEFKDSSEAVRITMADADLAVRRRDYDAALSMLLCFLTIDLL